MWMKGKLLQAAEASMMGELGRHPWRRTHASRFPGRRILAPHGQLVPLIMMGTGHSLTQFTVLGVGGGK